MDRKLKLFFTISLTINILLCGIVIGGIYFHNIILDNGDIPHLSNKFKQHQKDNKEIAKTCECARKRLKKAMMSEKYDEIKFYAILEEYINCKNKFTKQIFEKEKDFYLTLDNKEKEIYNLADKKRDKIKKLIKCHKQ